MQKITEPGIWRSRGLSTSSSYSVKFCFYILFIAFPSRNIASPYFPELRKALSSPPPLTFSWKFLQKSFSIPDKKDIQEVSQYEIVYYCTLCLQLQHSKFRPNKKFLTILTLFPMLA